MKNNRGGFLRAWTHLFIAVLLFCSPHVAFAESYVCLAVMVCDENYDLLEQYNVPSDPCFKYYENVCETAKEQLYAQICQVELFDYYSENQRLKRRLKRLRRQRNRRE